MKTNTKERLKAKFLARQKKFFQNPQKLQFPQKLRLEHFFGTQNFLFKASQN